MLNIVVPMAGRGSRFRQQGYALPKPLIPVHGIPMIEVVVNNLRPLLDHRFIFICQRDDAQQHGLSKFLQSIAPGARIILLDGMTEGAACTVLRAKHEINSSHPLMIANCDQWINASIDDYLGKCEKSGTDGFLMTMESRLPKWSFVRRSASGLVEEVVEKQVVSSEATVGIYNFARGEVFVRAAEQMIAENVRVNNEFYVAPTYSWLIRAGRRVETYCIGSDRDGMHGLGTPEDLEFFLTCGFEQRLRDEQPTMRQRAA